MTAFQLRLLLGTLLLSVGLRFADAAAGTSLAEIFAKQVTLKLAVPEPVQAVYARLLAQALEPFPDSVTPQCALLIDKSPRVQAALLFWKSPEGQFVFIGASPVSTGKPGRVDYFETPSGVFVHSPANPDYRALGTKNDLGIRGYGRKDMRVFDFGWQTARRGWGRGGYSPMRLQMHATDPDYLESRLGTAQSKGCIRIHATFNSFLDHYGILDAEYEQAADDGNPPRVLAPDREPVPWPGRYLVIVDTAPETRPAWSRRPRA